MVLTPSIPLGWHSGVGSYKNYYIMTTINQLSGCCYIVEFSNGRIKVGTTQHVLTRLKTHKSLALSSGIVATRFAHTKNHSNYLENEKVLIERLEKVGSVAHGREFFEDVEFDFAAQCLRELQCNNVDLYEENTSISTNLNFEQDVFSTKRDVPIYRVNPSSFGVRKKFESQFRRIRRCL